MKTASKAMYKPLTLIASVLAGLIAGTVFNQIWRRVGDDSNTAPEPDDLTRDIRAVLLAAVLQGAIFGLVKAVVERAGARGYRALTDENPT